MKKSYYVSPIGNMEIIYQEDSLISLKLVNEIKAPNSENSFSRTVKAQLDEYFSCERQTFDLRISPIGTEFQKKVWNELLKIPFGKTRSYFEIAQNIGSINAQRAVGNACNKNPIMIIIPCHRVISKNGTTGGYAYGNHYKEKLLEMECNKLNL